MTRWSFLFILCGCLLVLVVGVINCLDPWTLRAIKRKQKRDFESSDFPGSNPNHTQFIGDFPLKFGIVYLMNRINAFNGIL